MEQLRKAKVKANWMAQTAHEALEKEKMEHKQSEELYVQLALKQSKSAELEHWMEAKEQYLAEVKGYIMDLQQ